MAEKKMMRLVHFCEEYDIPRTSALDMIYSAGLSGVQAGRTLVCGYTEVPKMARNRA